MNKEYKDNEETGNNDPPESATALIWRLLRSPLIWGCILFGVIIGLCGGVWITLEILDSIAQGLFSDKG